MTTQAQVNALVDERIRDGAGFLQSSEIDNAIEQARLTYSRHRPRRVFQSITGDGTATYTKPTAWDDETSTIISVEYPEGETDPDFLDLDRVLIYYDAVTATDWVIRFRDVTPTASQTFRVEYWGLHTTSGAAITVGARDVHAFADLAASYCFLQLAARAAQSRDSTIDADAVDYGKTPEEYRDLSATFLKAYQDHMGIDDDESEAGTTAVAVRDYDPTLTWGLQRHFATRGRT